jgi:hypothetical protein
MVLKKVELIDMSNRKKNLFNIQIFIFHLQSQIIDLIQMKICINSSNNGIFSRL